MTPEHKALVGRLNAAGHDERLATGMLYLEAATVIEFLTKLQAEHEAERQAAVAEALERAALSIYGFDLNIEIIEQIVARIRALSPDAGEKVLTFTPTEVENLESFQRSGRMHPFTCPNRGDGKHVDLGVDLGALIPTVRGWICPFCEYTQNWAHDFMLASAKEKP